LFFRLTEFHVRTNRSGVTISGRWRHGQTQAKTEAMLPMAMQARLSRGL
jgi:hypothetical protein